MKRTNPHGQTEYRTHRSDLGAVLVKRTGPKPWSVAFGFWEADGFRLSHAKGCRLYGTLRGAERAVASWLDLERV